MEKQMGKDIRRRKVSKAKRVRAEMTKHVFEYSEQTAQA
jgi:hypothetical protein